MTRKAKPPVALYSALADATRCKIIEILTRGPVPVHKLAEAFPISRPAISRHLRVLKTAGLVVEVKKGRENLYTLRAAKLDRAVTWIEALRTSNTGEDPSEALPEVEIQPVSVEQEASGDAVAPAETPVVTVEDVAPNQPPIGAAEETVELAPTPKRKKKAERPAPEKVPEPATQMGFEF